MNRRNFFAALGASLVPASLKAEGGPKPPLVMMIETHPQLGGDVELDEDKLREALEEMSNGLQRYQALPGFVVKGLGHP